MYYNKEVKLQYTQTLGRDGQSGENKKKYFKIRGGGRLFNTARYLNATKYVQFQLRFSL